MPQFILSTYNIKMYIFQFDDGYKNEIIDCTWKGGKYIFGLGKYLTGAKVSINPVFSRY